MSNNSKLTIQFITKIEFDFLAKYRDFYCISIYLPNMLKGERPIEQIESGLREESENNAFKDVTGGIDDYSIQEHLGNLKPLIVDWKNTVRDQNIAIFMSNELIKVFEVETTTPFKIYINNHFYLKFFTRLFNANDKTITQYLKRQKAEKVITDDIHQIIKLSAKGKIEVLFLEKGKDLYGELDEENDFVLPLQKEKSGTSLSNAAAVHTIINKGNVFVVEKDQMPNPSQPINAIINL